MVKQSILIIYKNGSTISLDIPENYYQKKYVDRSDKKLHNIFIRDYKKFVAAINKEKTIIDVSKYLPFSNASISGRDIISVDIKDQMILENFGGITTFVPGVHDQVYLNIEGSDLEKLLKKLVETEFIEKSSDLIDKLYSYFYMSKSNGKSAVKPSKKPTTSRKRETPEINSIISDANTNQI